MEPEIVLLRAVGLLVGVPAFLLGVFWLLDRLESWVLKPDERAAKVQALLVEAERADEVEVAVTRLLAPFETARSGPDGLLARALPGHHGSHMSNGSHGKASPAADAAAGPAAVERTPAAPDSEQHLRRQEALADAQEALLEASTKEPAERHVEREAAASGGQSPGDAAGD